MSGPYWIIGVALFAVAAVAAGMAWAQGRRSR